MSGAARPKTKIYIEKLARGRRSRYMGATLFRQLYRYGSRLPEAEKELDLCDWAYLKMAETLGNAFLGKESDEATLLQAFILNQSGYRIRLARGNDSHLYLLIASDYTIYGKRFFLLDNSRFYLCEPMRAIRCTFSIGNSRTIVH